MIPIGQTLEWLNWERASQLTPHSRFDFWVWLIRETETPADEKREIVNVLIREAAVISNPLEQAEVLVHCGVYLIETGRFDEALEQLNHARNIYSLHQDEHRMGVVEWLMHESLHGKGDYKQAFYWGITTRKRFADFVKARARQKNRSQEDWYKERVADFTAKLALSPHYLYEWLIEIPRGKSRLGETAKKIQSQIREGLTTLPPRQLHEKLDLLLGISREKIEPGQDILDPCTYAEALVYCGLVQATRGNRLSAIHYYRSSLARFLPGSHEQAHARWMLGLAEFDEPSEQCAAIRSLETSLADIDRLRVAADHQNRGEDQSWYEAQSEGMKRALNHLVRRVG